jgi:hypothetical protein
MKQKNYFFSKKERRYRALQLQASLRSYHTLQVKFDLHGLCFLNYCEVISKRILIIFAPEEAEIFEDYLFILA